MVREEGLQMSLISTGSSRYLHVIGCDECEHMQECRRKVKITRRLRVYRRFGDAELSVPMICVVFREFQR